MTHADDEDANHLRLLYQQAYDLAEEWKKAIHTLGNTPLDTQALRQALNDNKDPAAHHLHQQLLRVLEQHGERAQQHTQLSGNSSPATTSKPVAVIYQGTEGSYSYMAATRYFSAHPSPVHYRGVHTFREMLEAVRDERATYAVLPIENTTAGSINESYDLLAHMSLSLVGEVIQPVAHCLLTLKSTPLHQIRRVFSHPQALAQCSIFLSNLHHCHQEAFTDTALAAAKVRDDGDPSHAAIASEAAAARFGLHIAQRNIANQPENFTRMVVVARQPVAYSTGILTKSSLIFATQHHEGALAQCLNVFAQHNLNLTKIESRPRARSPWQYLFYVDFEGNQHDTDVQSALHQLAHHTSFLKVLGTYPVDTTQRPSTTPQAPSSAATPANDTHTASRPPISSPPAKARTTPVQIGNFIIGHKHPMILAGPPLVDASDQAASQAQAWQEHGAHVFSLRCQPKDYGVDIEDLSARNISLFQHAQQHTGLPIMSDATSIGMLSKYTPHLHAWRVDAAHMRNLPLLSALGDIDRPVVLERGIAATLDEWLEAAQRIYSNGNKQIILCENGAGLLPQSRTLDLGEVAHIANNAVFPVIVALDLISLSSAAVGQALAQAARCAGAHGLLLETEVPSSRAKEVIEAFGA